MDFIISIIISNIFFGPQYSIPGEWKNYAMQYKNYYYFNFKVPQVV